MTASLAGAALESAGEIHGEIQFSESLISERCHVTSVTYHATLQQSVLVDKADLTCGSEPDEAQLDHVIQLALLAPVHASGARHEFVHLALFARQFERQCIVRVIIEQLFAHLRHAHLAGHEQRTESEHWLAYQRGCILTTHLR